MTDPQTVADLRDRLRAAAADRPAHARYLDALLALPDDADQFDVPHPGVSARIATALMDDVNWLRHALDTLPEGHYGASYGRRYQERRRADARAAGDARRTQERRERDPWRAFRI